MFIVLRRFTMVLTISLEFCCYGKAHAWPVLAAVAIMIGGALVAASTDLSFNPWGYAAVFTNDLFSAAYLVMLKHFGPAKNIGTTTLLGYTSLLSVLPLLTASWALGEMQVRCRSAHLPVLRSRCRL